MKRKLSTKSDQCNKLHEKNPYYNARPDFQSLVDNHQSLGKYLITHLDGKCSIDWNDKNTSKEITLAMLQRDFNLSFKMPPNHLCPPLPNRLNYLCWISDLMDGRHVNDKTHLVCDIGVGPLCIYPALGHSYFSWNFIGSDISSESIEYANGNIQTSPMLSSAVKLVLVSDSSVAQKRICEKYLSNNESTPKAALLSVVRATDETDTLFEQNPVTIQRGPLSNTISHCGAQFSDHLHLCELHALMGSAAPAVQRLLCAVMTNPPFYSEEEEASAGVL